MVSGGEKPYTALEAVPELFVVYCLATGQQHGLEAAHSYLSFVLTLAALFVVASGVFVARNIEGYPA
jgi:hypothetical protein